MTFKWNRKVIRTLVLTMLLVMILFLCGCMVHNSYSDMPFSGPIDFHEISLTIPEKYVRDSTQSTDDLWVFECGFYSEYILISRSDGGADTTTSLAAYADYMKEQGVASEITTFLENEAVHSAYTQDEVFCQEMLFAYNGSFYAIALRGGDEETFQSLLETVIINEATASA